jgi:hypothetical protein
MAETFAEKMKRIREGQRKAGETEKKFGLTPATLAKRRVAKAKESGSGPPPGRSHESAAIEERVKTEKTENVRRKRY